MPAAPAETTRLVVATGSPWSRPRKCSSGAASPKPMRSVARTEAVAGGGWIRVKALRQQAADIIGRFNVKAGGPDAPAKSLSGGNLQKFIVGREIDARPRLLIVSQPTWGVDVGAAAQIRGEILALRDAGCAVLVVSEELEELFEICDRLLVIAQGRVSPPVATARATVEQIGEWMSGLLKWSLKRADALIAISRFVAESLIASGHDERRLYVVLNAIEADTWHPGVGREDGRRELGLSERTTMIITVLPNCIST